MPPPSHTAAAAASDSSLPSFSSESIAASFEGNPFEFNRLQMKYRASQEDLRLAKERHAAAVASYEEEVAQLRRELAGSRAGSSSGGRK